MKMKFQKGQELQSGTKPLEKIHKTRIFNLNVGKQRVKTVSHTLLPHTMLLLAENFRSTLNGGGRGLEFYMNNRLREVVLFPTIFSTLLSPIVAKPSKNIKQRNLQEQIFLLQDAQEQLGSEERKAKNGEQGGRKCSFLYTAVSRTSPALHDRRLLN